MIELIILATIQGVVWGSICVYKVSKSFRKFCNRINPSDDSYMYESCDIPLNKIESLPMYEPRLPLYEELERPPLYSITQ